MAYIELTVQLIIILSNISLLFYLGYIIYIFFNNNRYRQYKIILVSFLILAAILYLSFFSYRELYENYHGIDAIMDHHDILRLRITSLLNPAYHLEMKTILAMIGLIFGHNHMVVYVLNFVLFIMSGIIIYLYFLFDENKLDNSIKPEKNIAFYKKIDYVFIGVLTAGLFLFYPLNNILANSINNSMFVIFLELLILFSLKVNKHNNILGMFIYLFLGILLVNLRVESILFIFIITAYTFLKKRGWPEKKSLILQFVIFCIIISPTIISFSNNIYSLSSVFNQVTHIPNAFKSGSIFLSSEYSPPIYLFLVVLGIIFLIKTKKYSDMLLYLIWFIIYFTFVRSYNLSFYTYSRIEIFYIIPLIFLSGFGMYYIYQYSKRIFKKLSITKFMIVFITVFIVINVIYIKSLTLEISSYDSEKEFSFYITETSKLEKNCKLHFPNIEEIGSGRINNIKEIMYISQIYFGEDNFQMNKSIEEIIFFSGNTNSRCDIAFKPILCEYSKDNCKEFDKHLVYPIKEVTFVHNITSFYNFRYYPSNNITIGFYRYE